MKILLLLILSGSCLYTNAQNDLKNDVLYYSFSVGAGIGHSNIFETGDIGIGAMLDFNLQKNKSIVTLGYHATGEFVILGKQTPAHSMSSLDIMYGHELGNKKISFILNGGLGLTAILLRGEKLYSEPRIFSPTHYAKIRRFTPGLPISLKISKTNRKHFIFGLEAYVNFNKYSTFYGFNLCGMFKKYEFGKKNKAN